MANRYAVKSGNWSDSTVWDGGTLPTSADIVRPNNFNVTIDQNITVQALRNDAASPAVAGGTFTMTGDYTVNISLDIQCFASSLFTYNGTGTAYITGTNSSAAIISSTTTNNTTTVTHNGTGHLIVDMVMNSVVSSEINRTALLVNNGGTLTCLKDVGVGETSGAVPAYGTPNMLSQTILVSTVNGAVLNLKNVDSKVLSNAAINCTAACTLNINGNVTMSPYNYAGGTNVLTTIFTSAATVINITGDVKGTAPTTQSQGVRIININANSTIVINGNILPFQINTTSIYQGANIYVVAGLMNLTINGDVEGPIWSTNQHAIVNSTGGVINITGNVTGGSAGNGSILVSAGTVNITGTITGGTANGVSAVQINGAAILNHVGIAQASNAASAITGNSTSAEIICTGPFLRNGYTPAVASQTLKINALSNPYFEFKKSDATNVTYIDQSTQNFPAISNVRNGVSYASGLYTGTLKVPDPSNVRKDIPTDNTVGTADLTAEDIWNYLTTNTFTAGSIGERVKNVSTVETTGSQIASFNS